MKHPQHQCHEQEHEREKRQDCIRSHRKREGMDLSMEQVFRGRERQLIDVTEARPAKLWFLQGNRWGSFCFNCGLHNAQYYQTLAGVQLAGSKVLVSN